VNDKTFSFELIRLYYIVREVSLFLAHPVGCNHTTAKAEYTIQYMHTWILKDECVVTYVAPIKQKKMHLINTMSVHGIIIMKASGGY